MAYRRARHKLAGVGILYVGIGFAVVPALLAMFHRLSRRPDIPAPRPAQAPGAAATATVAEEAERWLRSQAR